jgi:hypothetical protein
VRVWIADALLADPDVTEASAMEAPRNAGDPEARMQWVQDVLVTFYVWRHPDGSAWVADLLIVESLADL